MKFSCLKVILLTSLVLWSSVGDAREFIRIVGSSTVYPFAALIAEMFSRETNFTSPVVESNGTGGGFSQFCSGVGFRYPDINDASRQITASELALCNKNGINDPICIKLGYDGITLIHPKILGKINLTRKELFLAVSCKVPSKNNPEVWVNNYYKNWNEINSNLPNIPISIMGPPSTSGTRDTFVDLILKEGCKEFNIGNLSKTQYLEYCTCIRRDKAWQDGTENYSMLLQKVSEARDLFAIMGYNYYRMNAVDVSATYINGIKADSETISNHKYPLSRPLYMYVKREHLDAVPGLREFITELTSEHALGEKGYLASYGLIPLTKEDLIQITKQINMVLSK